MWRVGLVALLACAACSQVFGLTAPDHAIGGDDDDAGTDGTLTDSDPGVDAPLCYGTYETICFDHAPGGPLTLGTNINTGDANICMAASPTDVCAIGARTITITASVRVTGVRPLVLVGVDAITITSSGVLDGGSTRMGPNIGPGANANGLVCGTGTAPLSPGTAGGAGGSLAGLGGDGGDGTSQGGAAGGLPAAGTLRAGCAGQKGTGPNNGGNAGTGGYGGGAIYLLGAAVVISGSVTVGGAGGGAGNFSVQGASGGGGGGSGGMLVIETSQLKLMGGRLLANGGGGGEGSTVAANGMFGADANDIGAAPGGAALTNGGDGGDGSYGQQLAGGAAGTGQTGGGGGGGGGIIHTITPSFTNSSGTISPPRT